MSFEGLELSEPLMRAVREEGYEIATPIQVAAIPPLMAGRDLVGCAQTGTGKTAAFALPTLHRLSSGGSRPREQGRKVRCLVLAPTRELAAQIGESFRAYGRFTGLRHAVIFGGVGQHPQVKAIRAGVDILVATPGRLLDLMNQGYVSLDRIEVLILDEADQMLDMGFIHDLRRIIARVPRQRQTLLFSATMPPEIRRLADEWLRDPAAISVTPQSTPVEAIAQAVYFVEKREKADLLARYLKEQQAKRTLVFTRTKHGADKLVKCLMQAGIRAQAIHGNKSQNARQNALAQFKSQHPPVLVATDIASRGLDIDGVSHVVNFDLPLSPEAYVHRIGRTGRAGAAGVAVTFCDREERGMLRDIERITRQKLPVVGGDPGNGGDGRGNDGRRSGGQRVAGGQGQPPRDGGGRPASGGNRFRFQRQGGGGGPPHARFGGGRREEKPRRFSRA